MTDVRDKLKDMVARLEYTSPDPWVIYAEPDVGMFGDVFSGTVGEDGFHPIWDNSNNLRHVIACSPDNIRTISELVAELDAEIERLTPRKMAPVQGYFAGIPWDMHLRAYDAYCKQYSGGQQALIEGGCRGGFGVGELDRYIPGWRDELSALAAKDAEIERLMGIINRTGALVSQNAPQSMLLDTLSAALAHKED